MEGIGSVGRLAAANTLPAGSSADRAPAVAGGTKQAPGHASRTGAIPVWPR